MAKSSVQIHLDQGAVHALVGGMTSAAAKRAADKTRDRAKANVTSSGRVASGRMRDRIVSSKQASVGDVAVYEVQAQRPYSWWQEKGIGPVVPKRAKVLRFKPKGSDVFIFRPRTKGFKGAFFMERAYRALGARDYLP